MIDTSEAFICLGKIRVDDKTCIIILHVCRSPDYSEKISYHILNCLRKYGLSGSNDLAIIYEFDQVDMIATILVLQYRCIHIKFSVSYLDQLFDKMMTNTDASNKFVIHYKNGQMNGLVHSLISNNLSKKSESMSYTRKKIKYITIMP